MRNIRINLDPKVAAGSRINAVDELKGLAIALVILYHCDGVLGGTNFLHGEVGVDVFLILSGFTLALSSVTMPLRQFVSRRLMRIYPSYWIALILCLVLMDHFFNQTRSFADIFQHAIGVHGFSRLVYFSDISGSFWFISLILASYVVFAAVRKHLDNLSLLFALTGFLTLLATVVYQENGHFGGLISLAVRIPSFFVGLIAGRLLGVGTAEIRFDLTLGLGLLSFYYLTFFRGIACNYTLPAIGIILTWVGLRPYLARFAEGRFVLSTAALIGVYSYEIYLFHQPFVRDYNYYVVNSAQFPNPTHWQLIKGILLGLVATVAVSVAVHKAMGYLYAYTATKTKAIGRTALG